MGGRYGDDALIVAVAEPAVDGRATRSALRALAKALEVHASEVTLLQGATSRTKVVRVPDRAAAAVDSLLGD